MPEPESVKLPEIPGELWMLVCDNEPTGRVEAKVFGSEVCGILTFSTLQDAINAAAELADLYESPCRPVRVK